jgi:hypothetical protein
MVSIGCSSSNLWDGPMFITCYYQDVDIMVTISGVRTGEQKAAVRMGQMTYGKNELLNGVYGTRHTHAA